MAAAKGIPDPAPPSLSEDDFAKVRAAVLERDSRPKHSPLSPFVLGTNGATGSAATSSPVDIPVVPGSPSAVQQQQQQQSRWGSTSGGGSPTVRSADGKSGGGIDQRLFAPVLRAILAGEGDHVLRRSLLCHPFLKATKGGSTSAAATSAGASSWGGGPLGSKGSGSGSGSGAVASSPLSGGGRRKDGKGSKGGKAKKRDRDRDRASRTLEDLGGQSQGSPPPPPPPSSSSKGGGRGAERSGPLDVSREMGRLADLAASDGSLQSTLILVKTLLCAVDPGTKAAVLGVPGSPRKQAQQQGGRAGRTATSVAAERGSGLDSARGMGPIVQGSSACSTELTLDAAPLKALVVGPRLSGWADMMELLRREKYRERMVALRGRPSLTVCSGKADVRGRLEAKGEFAGVVTAVQVRRIIGCCESAGGWRGNAHELLVVVYCWYHTWL